MNTEVQKHLDRAEELLEVARLLGRDYPADSVSRSYYAMLHSARAVLFSLGIEETRDDRRLEIIVRWFDPRSFWRV